MDYIYIYSGHSRIVLDGLQYQYTRQSPAISDTLNHSLTRLGNLRHFMKLSDTLKHSWTLSNTLEHSKRVVFVIQDAV